MRPVHFVMYRPSLVGQQIKLVLALPHSQNPFNKMIFAFSLGLGLVYKTVDERLYVENL